MKEREHIISDINKWPIAQYYQNRSPKVEQLSSGLTEYLINGHSEDQLLEMINQTVYLEKLRVRSNALKVDPPNEISYWKKLESEFSKRSADIEKEFKDREKQLLSEVTVERDALKKRTKRGLVCPQILSKK